ncbi:DUF418 domain-containing protein [Candidatus Poriferisocius sp.]|uniref:DUF418 domain-containing protein n=1 Tax=Candidatus Poriferisocius sp. TaxID=3101276 RepID=UPI003B029836
MTHPKPCSAPVSPGDRNGTLDAIRGVAVLGILTMNAVSYGLETPAYFNLDAGGSRTWLDWAIGGAGEVLFDQKFMGLFSLLFGAGIMMFADRASARSRRPVWLSLWRNTLLLAIGITHMQLWEGDVLVLYAACSPLIIAARRLRPKVLVIIGTVLMLSVAVGSVAMQAVVDTGPSGDLAGYWFEGDQTSNTLDLWMMYDFAARALGMMLIGVALYRTGVVTGERSRRFYERMAGWGLGVGLPLSGAGLVIVAASGFSADWALAGAAPNTLATIPLCLGYLGLIALWDSRAESGLRLRVRATGRMALTNYLTQSVIGITALEIIFDTRTAPPKLCTRGVIGITALEIIFDDIDFSRSQIAVFILAVWAVQLWWSPIWMRYFRFGPLEWVWRCATYRRWQPLRTSAG